MSAARGRAVTLLALAAGGVLAGWTSTQEKSRQLADEGRGAFTERGLRVAKANPDVKVLDTAVLRDANGAAAVVVLRNDAERALVRLPVAIDVQGQGRRTLFRNDAPGLEPSLVSVPVVSAGRTSIWVNDQVVAASAPQRVAARVGTSRGRAPREVPKLRVQDVRLERQETTGIAARGFVRNESEVEQRDLVLHGIARRGGRIVAAGRGQIRRLRPGARSGFRMFFIGDPRDARLELTVPPTRLR